MTRLPISLDDPALDHLGLQQLLAGYGQLHNVGLLVPCLQKTKQDTFCQQLFDNVYQVQSDWFLSISSTSRPFIVTLPLESIQAICSTSETVLVHVFTIDI